MSKRPSVGERIADLIWGLVLAIVALAIAASLVQRYWPWMGGVLLIALAVAASGWLIHARLRRW